MEIQPLSTTQLGIIKIVKSAMKGTKENLPDDFDWAEAQRIIRNHSIEGLTYFGLKNMGMPIPQWLRESFLAECAFLTRLWSEAGKVMSAFDESGIEFVPLKGIKTKDLYPNKFMRHMSDVDILIHLSDYDEIRKIMIGLGWKEGLETDHELHWTKGNLNIELHKRIIPSRIEDLSKEVGDSWEWLKSHSDREYDFIHFAKHYRGGGIGIVHLCDLLYCEHFSGFGLDEFFSNVKSTLNAWFEDGEENNTSRLISRTIFDSGKYGTTENREYSKNLRRITYANGDVAKASMKKRISMLFPSWEAWKRRNPILNRWPVFLPFLWIWRVVSVPFSAVRRRNFKGAIDGVIYNSEHEEKLKFVGLHY